MKTEDIFITDYEIEAAFKFIAGLDVESNHAIHALGKTFLLNENTLFSITRSALQSRTLEPGPMIILAACFYIIGLHTGSARAGASRLEDLLNLSPSLRSSEKEEKK